MASPFLLFDSYGTLVELDDFYERLRRGFAQEGVELPIEVVARAARREMGHYIANALRAHQENDWHALRHECTAVLARAVREGGHALPLPHETVLQVLASSIVFRAFPETRTVLQALQQMKIPMGVLSNWDYQLPLVLAELGLDSYFKFVLSSACCGFEKPDARFFARGLHEARAAVGNDLSLADCFYIGDHFQKDVVPARACGMTPLWLLRGQRDIASGDIASGDIASGDIASGEAAVEGARDSVRRLSTLNDLFTVLKTKPGAAPSC